MDEVHRGRIWQGLTGAIGASSRRKRENSGLGMLAGAWKKGLEYVRSCGSGCGDARASSPSATAHERGCHGPATREVECP